MSAGRDPFWLLTLYWNGPFHCSALLCGSPDSSLVDEGVPGPPAGRERGPSPCSPCLFSRNLSPESSSGLNYVCVCAHKLSRELMLGFNFMLVTCFPEAMYQVSLPVLLCYSGRVIDCFFIYNGYVLCFWSIQPIWKTSGCEKELQLHQEWD